MWPVTVIRWRLDAERGDGGSGRAKCRACFTGRRFRFLNFSERHNLFRRQAALALERGFGQLQARTGREVLSALAPELWTCQFRQRLAAADRITGIDEQSRDPRRDRRADLGVGALIHRELAQEHDELSAGAGFDGTRRDAKIAQHALVDFHGVGVFLVCVGFGGVRCRRRGLRGLLGAAAAAQPAPCTRRR